MEPDPRYAPPAAKVDDVDEPPKVGFAMWLRIAATLAPVSAVSSAIFGTFPDGELVSVAAVVFLVGILASAVLGAVTIVQLIVRPQVRTVFSFLLAALNFLPMLLIGLFLVGLLVRLVLS